MNSAQEEVIMGIVESLQRELDSIKPEDKIAVEMLGLANRITQRLQPNLVEAGKALRSYYPADDLIVSVGEVQLFLKEQLGYEFDQYDEEVLRLLIGRPKEKKVDTTAVPIAESDDIYTVDGFYENVSAGGFNNYDGYGVYANKELGVKYPGSCVDPDSDENTISYEKSKAKKYNYTHVVWYNK